MTLYPRTIRTGHWLVIVAALTLSACAGDRYQVGTKGKPPAELAVIETPALEGYAIGGVDGINKGFGSYNKYHLLPGEHTVTFYLTTQGLRGEYNAAFVAEAGHTYISKVELFSKQRQWRVEIEEKDTHAVVSHRVPRPPWHDPKWD